MAGRERILIVNVNWRGDVLFSTPFIRAIREAYPDSFIATMVVPRCVAILENNPRLNEVIVFDEDKGHRGLWGKLRFLRLLRSRHFDTAFLLHRSFTRTLICALAGIPERIGYYNKKRAILLTKSIALPQKPVHKVEYFLNIARQVGVETENKDYEFFLSLKDKDYIRSLLQKHKVEEDDFLIVVNPGGNWDLKRWPEENFAQVCDSLIRDYRAKIIITGAETDLILARNIASLMKNRPLIFCGQTTLGQLAALMARVDLVISNDSGPMHIAVSQRAKVIALFGPTSAEITGPYGRGNYIVIQKDVGCKTPCYQLDCKDNRCMKAITVEEVLGAVRRLGYRS